TGVPLDPATTPAAHDAVVSIGDGATADSSRPFRGWLIVNGRVRITGSLALQGLVYALDDLAYPAAGPTTIAGQPIPQNLRTPVSSLEPLPGGEIALAYGCAAARTGGGQVPQRFIVKLGTYREVPDP